MNSSVLFADRDITISRVVLGPGEKLAEDIRAAQSETIVILRGRITIQLPDRKILCWLPESVVKNTLPYVAMHQQHSPIVPSGTPHTVTNVTDSTAEYISIMRRASDGAESTKTACPRCNGPAVIVDKAPPGESGDVVRCDKEKTCAAVSEAAARLSEAKDAVSDLASEVVDEGFSDSGLRALQDVVRDWRKAGNAFLAAVAAHGRTT